MCAVGVTRKGGEEVESEAAPVSLLSAFLVFLSLAIIIMRKEKDEEEDDDVIVIRLLALTRHSTETK